MSRLIAVMGESGSGKTTAMRTLDPTTTYYIDCDGKGLAWQGWRKQYNAAQKNFYQTRNIPNVLQVLQGISAKRQDVKTVVIDTINTCMIDQEIKNMKQVGYGKWTDLAQFVWDTIEGAGKLREDLTVIMLFHSETIKDEDGYCFTRIRTNGRKLEKVILESLFGTVLLARSTDDGRHIFETQAKNSTAKTPLGAFDDFEIENDMQAVLQALSEY